MSSRILLQPIQFEVKPLSGSGLRDEPQSTYSLRFLFSEGGVWQSRFPTHIPPEFVAEFEAGRVVEAHLETLDLNGIPQQSLHGSPDYAVLGILLSDGTKLLGIPKTWVRARRRRIGLALVTAAAGAMLVGATGFLPALGGLLLGLSLQPLRTALGIPVKAAFSVRVKSTPQS